VLPGRRPTLADLAREAGVSRSTASRAVAGRGYVAGPVRERISAAAERIGYIPDAVARSLRERASRSIGVLISDLRNPFYAEVASAAEQRLRSRGYHILVANSDGDPDEELVAARLLGSSRVPGAIVAPVAAEAARRLLALGVAVVEVDRQMTGGACDAVLLENEVGAWEAVHHLTQLGHRRIGLLLGETRWTTGVERLAGYRRALREAGIAFDGRAVHPTSFHQYHPSGSSRPEAAQATSELLDRCPDLTAIFATNNVLAEGAVAEAQRRRLRLPRDLSIVAFDDEPWMTIVQPGITAVAQPTADIGRAAADLLLERLATTHRTEPVVVRLPPELVVRGSTGPPRAEPKGRQPAGRRRSGLTTPGARP
jgi:LacI family transcriptional regulator